MMDVIGTKMDFKNRGNWVAIIGSRNASKEELDVAHKLGMVCAKKGKIVVSGLAKGIDRAGHEGAIDGGGKTIALVSTPMSLPIYPPENKDLAERIKENGCIIYPFRTKPTFIKGEMNQNVKRLMERSILNAYLCPNIVIVKDSNTIITGGTKWATNYGLEIGHNVFRLDNNFIFHKNPDTEESKAWWLREMNIPKILQELDSFK